MNDNLDRYRSQFDYLRDGRIFLNHAGTSPFPRCVVEAIRRYLVWNQTLTPDDWKQILGKYNDARRAIARMLRVEPDTIALSRNTTEGINWVANGIDWKKGDRVVTVNKEYPANIYPWRRLQERGVDLHLIEPVEERVPLEVIEKALTSNVRLLTLSFVEFSSGFRFDLEAVGRLCKEKEVLFHVDLIQGMGVFPIDLKRWRVDFASGGGQKWLLGPQGSGFFYCPVENLDRIQVSCVGATSVKHWLPYTEYDFTLADGAKRFEYGTPSMPSIIGMGAAVDMLLEAGMEYVRDRVRLVTDTLIDGATRKGFRCHSPRGETEWSGIVMLSHPTDSPHSIVHRLQANHIEAVEREGLIRFSPHFYQTEDEMKRVVDAL